MSGLTTPPSDTKKNSLDEKGSYDIFLLSSAQ